MRGRIYRAVRGENENWPGGVANAAGSAGQSYHIVPCFRFGLLAGAAKRTSRCVYEVIRELLRGESAGRSSLNFRNGRTPHSNQPYFLGS